MPGEVNCIFTKGLIPFVEKEVGAEGGAAICRVAGRPRDYLMADHNWIPLSVANDIVRVANGYGMSVIARIPNIQPNTINLWLDRGIQGVTGPHIETREEAQQLADACLFPPDGWRSWGGGRGTEQTRHCGACLGRGRRAPAAPPVLLAAISFIPLHPLVNHHSLIIDGQSLQ